MSGEVPGERYGHAAAVEERGGGVLLVFAGCDPEGQFSRELLHFNFGTTTLPLHSSAVTQSTATYTHTTERERERERELRES